jgi:UDP-glucose 4-epimerase
MGDRNLPIEFTGIRPGEKVHEIMVSEEECFRTYDGGDHYIIDPVLPELRKEPGAETALTTEYSSKDNNLNVEELTQLLRSSSDEIGRFLTTNA